MAAHHLRHDIYKRVAMALYNSSRIFLFAITSGPAYPASYPVCTGVLSSGGGRSGREGNPSPSSNAEVNAWKYTFTPSYVCLAWCSVTHQGQLCLYLAHVPIFKANCCTLSNWVYLLPRKGTDSAGNCYVKSFSPPLSDGVELHLVQRQHPSINSCVRSSGIRKFSYTFK
jgi:hypothetical protein